MTALASPFMDRAWRSLRGTERHRDGLHPNLDRQMTVSVAVTRCGEHIPGAVTISRDPDGLGSLAFTKLGGEAMEVPRGATVVVDARRRQESDIDQAARSLLEAGYHVRRSSDLVGNIADLLHSFEPEFLADLHDALEIELTQRLKNPAPGRLEVHLYHDE